MTTSKHCIMSNGTEMWLKNGKLHRTEGPAIIRSKDNSVVYYINGMQYNFHRWFAEYGKKTMTEKELTLFLLRHNFRN